MGVVKTPGRRKGRVKNKITCPHCWHVFDLENLLAIAAHPDLRGDEVLGSEAQQRFRPSHFSPDCKAIDARGEECPDLACPRCHLIIPRGLTRKNPIFLSIVGAAASGKTYLLTAMVRELRNSMYREFGFSFGDADNLSNEPLHDCEKMLFGNPDDDQFVQLQKTQRRGSMHDQISLDGLEVWLPRPLMFSLEGQPHHPWYKKKRDQLEQLLIVYDNAGEDFYEGSDSTTAPVTRHLVRSSGILFVFDPCQDKEFQRLCRSSDPQMAIYDVRRQDQLLSEAIHRIERHSDRHSSAARERPLIVVVNKYDVWHELLDLQRLPDPWVRSDSLPTTGLNRDSIAVVSFAIRNLLLDVCPALVDRAESFSKQVTYLPASPLGHSPMQIIGEESDGDQAQFMQSSLQVRPADIDPVWATVPLLYMLAQLKLIPVFPSKRAQKLPVAQDCRRSGDMLTLTVPGTSETLWVPDRYLGCPLRAPESKKLFRLPAENEMSGQ